MTGLRGQPTSAITRPEYGSACKLRHLTGLFFPNSSRCDHAADWAAAAFTFIAVVVALITSQKALRAQSLTREQDKAEQALRGTALAGRLAIVFDHEILVLAPQLNAMSRELRRAINARNRAGLIDALAYEFSRDSFALLAANTSNLHVFDGETAAKLMIALSAWNSILILRIVMTCSTSRTRF